MAKRKATAKMKDLVTLIDLVQAWIDRTEADACTECKYFGTEEWEMPCKECCRAKKDYWRRRDG